MMALRVSCGRRLYKTRAASRCRPVMTMLAVNQGKTLHPLPAKQDDQQDKLGGKRQRPQDFDGRKGKMRVHELLRCEQLPTRPD